MFNSIINRLRNNSIQGEKENPGYIPTTIKIDFFSGYDVVSVNGLYGHQNSFGGWNHEEKNNHIIIHLKKVISC